MDRKSYQAELSSAAHWHAAQTLEHAAAWGLGEERRFTGDQEKGTLTLHFDAGDDVVLPMQFLASFDPHDGTFRWAWANASVDPALRRAVETAHAWGEANGIADFVRPVAQHKFGTLARLVALAGMKSGCEGVYRGVSDDSLSIFMGFGKPLQGVYWPNGQADTAFQDAARALVAQWHAENLPLDAAYQRDNSQMDALLDMKDAIYDRTWHRNDDYWRPCSFGWPSDHDPNEHTEAITLPRRAGGAYVVTRRGIHCDAHVVEHTAVGIRITDQDLEWGNGLFWCDV